MFPTGRANVILLLLARALLAGFSGPAPSRGTEAQGVTAAFSEAGVRTATDVATWPRIALYVPSGQTATPLLSPGPFDAVFSGFIASELRRAYRFQAEGNGRVKLEIDGTALLETNLVPGLAPVSPAFRLRKGTNAVRVEFSSPDRGDAWLRLNWIPKGGLPSPIPTGVLTFDPKTPGLEEAEQLRLGRQLLVEHRCLRCHNGHGPAGAKDEIAPAAPSLEGIGSRRKERWMARWILDPHAQRSIARMPRLFHGPDAARQAQAAAAFLATLQEPQADPAQTPASGGDGETGRKLFDTLHCSACHLSPGDLAPDPDRMSLAQVAEKFPRGRLVEFLRKPQAHFEWIRMPDFHLSLDEASAMAAYLNSRAAPPEPAPAARSGPDLVEEGRRLVQTSGCLQCHPLRLENRFRGPPLETLRGDRWTGGCLAESSRDSQAPSYAFTSAERAALQRFGMTDADGWLRSAPASFAQREFRQLRCQACHGGVDGLPSLQGVGAKLKPEWTRAFLAGEIPYKPRPWLEARMPAFPGYATGLAAGFAMEAGYPPRTPPEPPLDKAAAEIGRQLASTQGGLSCLSCHAVGATAATQVFENAGVNFAYGHARLLKPYFELWVRNPLAIDPVSKMPVFFDETLRSPLSAFYDGDGRRQIEALWQYLREEEIQAPRTEPGAGE